MRAVEWRGFGLRGGEAQRERQGGGARRRAPSPVTHRQRTNSPLAHAEDVSHRIETRLSPVRPKSGAQGAAREDCAVLGNMPELYALAIASEDHAVIADHG